MIELLLPCGFDTLEYSWMKVTIGICTLVDYSVAKKRQHRLSRLNRTIWYRSLCTLDQTQSLRRLSKY
jgi:hypothetical protein